MEIAIFSIKSGSQMLFVTQKLVAPVRLRSIFCYIIDFLMAINLKMAPFFYCWQPKAFISNQTQNETQKSEMDNNTLHSFQPILCAAVWHPNAVKCAHPFLPSYAIIMPSGNMVPTCSFNYVVHLSL